VDQSLGSSTVAQSFSLAFEEDSEPISEKKAQKPATWSDKIEPQRLFREDMHGLSWLSDVVSCQTLLVHFSQCEWEF
jgi:hypothetical protein